MQILSGGYVNRSSGSRGNYKKEVYKSSFKQQAVSNGGGYYTKSYAVEVKVTEKLTYRNSYPKANAVRARW
ncbi:hypothetical protein LIER_01766 [Lithospermum erythrorhizon]|uniref:Uncharacterized protein n=1 Tax=Lithospermum erythrorhizon TaxID=34254 RepID=A0AAV3NNL0_LITER